VRGSLSLSRPAATMKRMKAKSAARPAWKTRVEKATVRIDSRGGLGVLVPGAFILTATHCIQWSGTGGMALGDVYPESITTADGVPFRVGLAALPS
jgi:hypothetical protein